MSDDFWKAIALIMSANLLFAVVLACWFAVHATRQQGIRDAASAERTRASRVLLARGIVQAQEIRDLRATVIAVARLEQVRSKTVGTLVDVASRQNSATRALAVRTGLIVTP